MTISFRYTLGLALAATFGGAAGVPASAQTTRATTTRSASTGTRTSVMQSDGARRMHHVMIDGRHTIEAWLDGRAEFTDDYRDVRALSPGGRLVLEEHGRGPDRRLVFGAGDGGAATREYLVDGRPHELDDDGRRWAGDFLEQLTRDEGIGADRRTARLYGQGGVDAVLREIRLVHSDGGASIWYAALLARPGLPSADAARTLAEAGRQIGSDGDKSELLQGSLRNVDLGRPEVARAWFGAVRTIGSDGDASTTLVAALRAKRLDDVSAALLLDAARAIGSDGDKSSVLIETVRAGLLAGPAAQRAFFGAVETIGSDGDRSEVLRTVLARHGDRVSTVSSAIRAARPIGSDGDKAAVLLAVPRERLADPTVRQAYHDTLVTIGSDGDRESAAAYAGMGAT